MKKKNDFRGNSEAVAECEILQGARVLFLFYFLCVIVGSFTWQIFIVDIKSVTQLMILSVIVIFREKRIEVVGFVRGEVNVLQTW